MGRQSRISVSREELDEVIELKEEKYGDMADDIPHIVFLLRAARENTEN